MPLTVAPMREKASTRSVAVGVYLTDGERLYEVREVAGAKILKAGNNQIPMIESARLVDVLRSLPIQARVERREGAWVPIAELLQMWVVVPERTPA